MPHSTTRKPRSRRAMVAAAALLVAVLPGGGLAAQAALPSAMPSVAAAAKCGSGALVITRAREFLATLGDEQRSQVVQAYSLANASRWHTYPDFALPGLRLGLSTGTLSAAQWRALEALFAAALGSTQNEGYDEWRQQLFNDDYLNFGGTRPDYGRKNYRIAFLGEPSLTGKWELQFGGHQLAVANTYSGGKLVGATPSFRGVEPQTFELNGSTYAPQRQEWESFVALLGSLTAAQLRTAKLPGDRPEDLLMFPGSEKWTFPSKPEGLPGSALTPSQRGLLIRAISKYVDDLPATEAAAIMATYKSQLDTTYVSFAGAKDLATSGDYVRIDGPRLWIELRMDEPYSTTETAPHTLWRDKVSDYGGTRS